MRTQLPEAGPRTFRPPMRAGAKLLIAGACLVAVTGAAAGCAAAAPSQATSHLSRALGAPSRTDRGTTPAASVTPPGTPAPASAAPAAAAPAAPAPASAAPAAATSSLLTVLAPATVPPAGSECTLQLTNDADGNVTPLLCPGGGVNTNAWRHDARGFAGGQPVTWSKVLGLGPQASAQQVYQAMCSDYQNVYGTRPITESAEQLAQAYYGWTFAGNSPLAEFESLGCPAS
jgi:hypothetical protein